MNKYWDDTFRDVEGDLKAQIKHDMELTKKRKEEADLKAEQLNAKFQHILKGGTMKGNSLQKKSSLEVPDIRIDLENSKAQSTHVKMKKIESLDNSFGTSSNLESSRSGISNDFGENQLNSDTALSV